MAGLSKLDAGTLEAGRTASQPPQQTKPKPTGRFDAPKRFADATFETFDLSRNPKMGPAVEAVRAVVEGKQDSAFLYGPPGLGKTHLAWAAVHAALERGQGSTFWEVPELLTFLRSLVGQEPETASTTVELVVQRHSTGVLLVLDDLGAHNPTGWAEEQLYMILNGRYKNEAPTIITANVGMERIDPRIRSRFRAGFVPCEGEDQRGRS